MYVSNDFTKIVGIIRVVSWSVIILRTMRGFLRDELGNAAAAISVLELASISEASMSDLAMIPASPWELPK